MCLAGIAQLDSVWEDDGARVGRLDGGDVVTLAFVPDAEPGSYLLMQLGIPVEIVDPADAAEARALRAAHYEGGVP
jgi:hydrogenase expression/formation protein HypC